MKRYLFLTYGVVSHAVFLVLFIYMAGFVAGVVPYSIDAPVVGSVSSAVVINLLLIALFAAQHSVMARPGFKQVWTKIIPAPIERSTYVLLSNVVVAILMWQWRPIDSVIWNVETPLVRWVIWGVFIAGWLLVPGVTLLINHFDLFGTRQVWLHARNREYSNLPFRTPSLYRHVRHPLYIGWGLAFWAIPTMTAGHLLFAVSMTVYMVAATWFEEHDLVTVFGDQYRHYQRTVPRFIPRLTKRNQHSGELSRPLARQ